MITDLQGIPIHDSDQAILVADDDGRYVDVNRPALDLLGYTRDELLGRTIWNITPAEYRDEGKAQFAQMARSGEDAGRWLVVRADGTRLEIFYVATANAEPGRHASVIRPAAPPLRFGLQ